MYYFLFGALRAEEGKTQRAHEISHWIQKDEEEEVCQAVRMPTLFFFFVILLKSSANPRLFLF